jgi:hypothetical protein
MIAVAGFPLATRALQPRSEDLIFVGDLWRQNRTKSEKSPRPSLFRKAGENAKQPQSLVPHLTSRAQATNGLALSVDRRTPRGRMVGLHGVSSWE